MGERVRSAGRPRPPLGPEDLQWWLDHSRRTYRVRPSKLSDHPALACRAVTAAYCLTIIRLGDGRKWVVGGADVFFESWADTDEYAALRTFEARLG